jgi:hypothetical protein
MGQIISGSTYKFIIKLVNQASLFEKQIFSKVVIKIYNFAAYFLCAN